MRLSRGSVTPAILAIRLSRSTLPLFVTRIGANDQHRTLTTDHLALLTHRFTDARTFITDPCHSSRRIVGSSLPYIPGPNHSTAAPWSLWARYLHWHYF